ncbi:glucose-6-phosphate dehydrogenase [Candidatus Roizmanbacteria bacterium]|nr:glucose-6-phosphate dehydrogenase [Candidatus Roizmanbacteria bacterium]
MSNKFNIPTVVIVYGATGDLMARKITPALFHLYSKDKLPKMFHVIGVARRSLTNDAFRAHILKLAQDHAETPEQQDKLDSFSKLFFYHQGRFEERADYDKLAREMGVVDEKWNVCSNKLFYLAVPPTYYKTILTHLHDSHLTDPCSPDEGWTRVLVEKPFGSDLATAQELDELLSKLFKEEQIYRIDHYLGKEMLQNILAFRFSNNFLEQSWDNRFISRIDIRLLEDNDASKRGAFYESVGAFRDVGQNHLLQMLALVTMDNPGTLTADAIRRKRAEVLQTLDAPTPEEIKQSTIRAQYEGYREHSGVDPHSQVETYFKARACLSSSRWDGVPIYLSSGKGFSKPQKDITITFRNPQVCLNCEPGKDYNNQVVFSLEPEETISIKFFSKKPGLDLIIHPQELAFTYRTTHERRQYVEEYEKLLLDVIRGDQTLFVSTAEVLPMWQYTDAIVQTWSQGMVPLRTYKRKDDAIAEEKTVDEIPKVHPQLLRHEIGIVGLGKMGGGIAQQLHDKGWRVYGYNRSTNVTESFVRKGMYGIYDMKEFIEILKPPRIILISLPEGKPVDDVLFGEKGLALSLSKGDIIIDGGNSNYRETIRRHKQLAEKGIVLVDAGISGGPEGARFGACVMVGGKRTVFDYLEPIFADISVPRGYQFFEGVGAGHFVKMIHNGIEYAMMQALAEGFTLLKQAPFTLDLTKVADVYNHGSVIESRLVSWLKDAYMQYGVDLKEISGYVSHSGEGKWTVETAKEMGVAVTIIDGALQFRIDSEKNQTYTGKVVSALRGQFGGHEVKR